MGIRVFPERLNVDKISNLQCGQFIEFLCDLVPGMYAEMVCDGSFEGLLPYNVEFIRQTDFREHPWYPSGAVHRGEYELDSTNVFNGKFSLRITARPGGPCILGVSQDGMFIQQDKIYLFSCFLRQEGVLSPITVCLGRDSKSYCQYEFTNVTDRWGKFRASLIPKRSDRNATLTIEFRAPGTLWIDKVSLMPKDNVGGWRSDVVRAVRALRPGIIRFGGSAIKSYEWKDGISNPDFRVPFVTVWGGREQNNVGLEEFIGFCRAVGAEPLICIRYTDKTSKDAADQVEYFNGSADAPYGRMRAANGHPEPYNVKYWQIGNEVSGSRYEQDLPAFCKAMKKVDPSIRLLSSLYSRELIKAAGAYLDYVCPHQYGCGNLSEKEAEIQRIRQDLKELAPGQRIKIAVTEWNTTGGDWGLGRGSLWTLDNALICARYHNLIQRHCDVVEIAIRSNLTNSFCSGVIQTRGGRLFKTPTYYVEQLYSQHSGVWPLYVESDLSCDQLDFSASLSGLGTEICLFAVNYTTKPISVELDLSTFAAIRSPLKVWTLMDTERRGERDAFNSIEEPRRIRTVASSFFVNHSRFLYIFQPLTVTALKCRLTKRFNGYQLPMRGASIEKSRA